ncbi:unnamed protein product [Lymnaea stagnalis]|uniref:UDP-N-acetylglucosamine transferase subunit ALG14 n=1 Tax=Lymnaea stagnalis TaxID=6523 RepID=A0AAV2HG89_LYMST
MLLAYFYLIGLFLTVIFIFAIMNARSKSRNRQRRLLNRTKSDGNNASVLIVVGSGGHTSEILSLVKALGNHYMPRYYIVADTDLMSEHKIEQCEKTKGSSSSNSYYQIFTIPRSREVKQSYLTSVWSTFRALIFSFPLVFKLRPEVILCNGPGTCIPICVAGYFLKLFTGQTTIVYVESFCRVKTLSLSGSLLYHFADHFMVQWPELVMTYPKAKYIGRLV